MRYLWPIIIIGAILAGIMPAAEKVVDLSGTWILDPAKNQTNQTTPSIRKIRISRGRVTPRIPDENDSVDSSVESALGKRERSYSANRPDRWRSADPAPIHNRQRTEDGSSEIRAGWQPVHKLASDGRGEFVSRTSWKKGKLINSGTQTITIQGPRTEIYVNEEYSISKNREKLTIKTMSTTPEGVTTLKQVFHKREKLNPEFEK